MNLTTTARAHHSIKLLRVTLALIIAATIPLGPRSVAARDQIAGIDRTTLKGLLSRHVKGRDYRVQADFSQRSIFENNFVVIRVESKQTCLEGYCLVIILHKPRSSSKWRKTLVFEQDRLFVADGEEVVDGVLTRYIQLGSDLQVGVMGRTVILSRPGRKIPHTR